MRIVDKIYYELEKREQYWKYNKVKRETQHAIYVFDNKSTLYFHSKGFKKNRPTYLLIGGFGGNISDVPHFVEKFQEDYNLVYIELPGFGLSFNENSDDSKKYSKDYWTKVKLVLEDLKISKLNIISNCHGSNLIINALYNELRVAKRKKDENKIKEVQNLVQNMIILTPTEESYIQFKSRILNMSKGMVLIRSIPFLRKVLLTLFEYKKLPLLKFKRIHNDSIRIINKRFYTLPYALDPILDVAVNASSKNYHNSLKIQFSEKNIQDKILFLEQYLPLRVFFFLKDGLLQPGFEKKLIIKYETVPDLVHFTFNRDGIFFKELILDKIKN